jgi:hemerythrin superfamily protein
VSSDDAQQDMIDVLIEDHREVQALFRALQDGNGDPQHRRDLADAMTAELVRHSIAEEEYLYPTAREVLPDGDKEADHEIEEHAEVERLLKELDGVDATEPRFDELTAKVIEEVGHHLEEEENDLFPRLRQACTAEQLTELGHKVQQAKKTAPTRPHPAAPDHPPYNKLLAPGAGLVDRLRDALTGRTTSPDDALDGGKSGNGG